MPYSDVMYFGGGGGGTIKFWPFVSCQLNLRPFVSCQLIGC